MKKKNKPKTFYSVKYWKTEGIQKITTSNYDEEYVIFRAGFYHAEIGKEAFETEKEARLEIDVLTFRKIENLEKQIYKLKEIDSEQIKITDYQK